MKKILIIFILLNTFIYGDVFEKAERMITGRKSFKIAEQSVKYDEDLLEKLDFSNPELKETLDYGITVEEQIKDLDNPEYVRWAIEIGPIKILSVAFGPKRETNNYVFRENEEGKFAYMGNYFYGNYTTGITFIEDDEVYIMVYYLDSANKELVLCKIFNKDIEKIGEISRGNVDYVLKNDSKILSEKELKGILAQQKEKILSFEDETYRIDFLNEKAFVLDYNNDSNLEEMYLEFYRSETYNTLDELKVEFSNDTLDEYFKDALGRVVALKVFSKENKVYMAFLEKEAFYTDRHYGNYIRIFLAEGDEITEVDRVEYREEKEFEIERM